MQLSEKSKSKFVVYTAILLLLTLVLGRVVSYFHSVSATDIAYADWIPTLLSYVSEVLTCARIVISFTAVAAAAYYLDRSALVSAIVLSAAAALLDFTARFVIDLVTSSLTGMELIAVIWLLLQFVYEMIFLVLAVLIVLMMKKKAVSAETRRTAEKYACIRAIRYAVILVLLSHFVLEAYYLVDFLLTYTGITNTEIASIIGSFLKILVIYGGIALLFAEGMYGWYAGRLFIPAEPEN